MASPPPAAPPPTDHESHPPSLAPISAHSTPTPLVAYGAPTVKLLLLLLFLFLQASYIPAFGRPSTLIIPLLCFYSRYFITLL